MSYRLDDIPGMEAVHAPVYSIKALVIEGESPEEDTSPAIEALADWKETSPADFKAIRKCLRMAASVRKTELGHLDCVSRDSKGSGIFEACARGRKTGKDARLFFFHYEPQRAIVCLNVCWKAKDKGKRQTRAFDDAAELMRDFLEGREGRTTP